MARLSFIVTALCLLGAGAAGAGEAQDPIGKTLELLSSLQKNVIKDGEVAQKEYADYSEWCADKHRDLSNEIKSGKSQVASLQATVQKEGSKIDTNTAKIGELAASIASEDADLKAATGVRAEQAAAFAKEEKELKDIINTVSRAISAVNKGGSAALLQMARLPSIVAAFGAMVDASMISSADVSKLTALVQSSAQDGSEDSGAPAGAVYEGHSGGVVDTLEGLQEKAEEQLSALQKTETTAARNFESLRQSLEDEVKYAKKDLAAAKNGVAAASEAKSVAEGDLEVTSKDLAADVNELNDVHKNCESTAADFEGATKSRDEELAALAQAKQAVAETTGAAGARTYGLDQVSLLQEKSDGSSNFEVVRFVRRLARKQDSAQLAQLASRMASTIRFSARVGQDPFAKVKGLISELIDSLEAAGETDASHKAYCDKEAAETKEKQEDKSAEFTKLSTAVDKATSRIAVLEEEVAELTKELANLAAAKASYDEFFREAEAAFTSTKADLQQGIDGVKLALKILREYYAGDAAHGSSGDEASGIVGLLEVVESDFAKGLAEAEAGFGNLKASYEAFGKETELTGTTKNQDVKYKSEEATKLKKALGQTTGDRKGVSTELDAILEYSGKIASICTSKAEPYEERKARREAELAGLKDALQVLGGEAALLQRGHTTALRGAAVSRHA